MRSKLAALATLVFLAAGGCAVVGQEDPQPALGASSNNLKTYNSTQASIWVTIYEDGGLSRQITQSGCVAPGATGEWSAWPNPAVQQFYVRAEMTRNANCQQPVDCDTTMTLAAWKYYNHKYNYVVTLKANPQTCWWDNPYQ